MRNTKLSVSLAAALLAAAIGALPAGAQVQCGDRIRPGQEVVLDEDLNCAGSPVALVVTGPAVLDLNGFAITCAVDDGDGPAPQVGILLLGWAVTVRNGLVDGCPNGIVAAGSGFHRLDGVATLSGSGDGIVLASDASHVRDALALFHDGAGIAVRGSASVVTGSFVIGNQVGFLITGSGAVLADNRAEDNLTHGVRVGPQARALAISGTAALRNGIDDLADETPGCGDNHWRDNRFATRNQPCVE